MKTLKEQIADYQKAIKEQAKENMTTLPKSLKSKCYECGKVFAGDGFCSDKCQKAYAEKSRKQTWIDSLWQLPRKFIDLEPYPSSVKIMNDHKGNSMFITGASGVGKSVLLAGIFKQKIRNNEPAKWISYPEFIIQLQGAFKKYDNNQPETDPYLLVEETANYSGCLCIDDLGAEKLTPFVRQTTYLIINKREQELLQTIITSNYSLEEIDAQIDARVSSRIGGMCEIVKLLGSDRRLSK